MDTGILIIRMLFGLAMAGHGAQKLFGWFGGYGIKTTGGFFESIGFVTGLLVFAAFGAAVTLSLRHGSASVTSKS